MSPLGKNLICHSYVQTPRGALHYAEAGEGPPLLLLHATPRSHRAFRHMLPLLAPHFRAIAIDAPGYGASYRLPGSVDMAWFGESLAQILDGLGLERAHLFALHTGNKIAAAFARDFPDRIDRFVFAGQTHSIIIEGPDREREIRLWCDRFFPQYQASPDGAHHLRDWVATHAVIEGHWWPQKLLTGAEVTEEDIAAAEIRVIDHMQGWRSIVPTYEAILSFDLPTALRAVQAPTLVLELLAANEAHLPRQAERICAIMPRAIPGHVLDADGLTPERRPAAIVEAFLPFLLAETAP
jgi:pimeloyl-ACP methyl ester carboxylesterase